LCWCLWWLMSAFPVFFWLFLSLSWFFCNTVILQFGGNDADRDIEIHDFNRNYLNIIQEIQKCNEVKHIVVGGIVPRFCEWLFSPQLKHGRRRGGRTCTFLFRFGAPFGGVSFWSFSCFMIPTLSFILFIRSEVPFLVKCTPSE
jgi:hypothetical protein